MILASGEAQLSEEISMFGGLGVPELIIILIVVLVIFGPKNLPKLGASLGKTVKNIREGMNGGPEASEPVKAERTEASNEPTDEV